MAYKKVASAVDRKQIKQIASGDQASEQMALTNPLPPAKKPLRVVQDPNNDNGVCLTLDEGTRERFLRIAQTDNLEAAQTLVAQAGKIVSRCAHVNAAEGLSMAFSILEDLAPEGPAQAMLAVQLIAAHFASLSNLTKSTTEGISMEQSEMYLNRSTRLMRLNQAQLELWSRLKGQTGQQRVTVEHVTVNQGGQAVVGMVTKGGGTADEK